MFTRAIPGHPDYHINRDGEIFSIRNQIMMKPHNGFVVLSTGGQQSSLNVSLLVLEVFGKSCPPGLKVVFVDGNRNNNALSNLTYDLPRCRKGHAFVEENLYFNPSRAGVKHCVTCRDEHYYKNEKPRKAELRASNE